MTISRRGLFVAALPAWATIAHAAVPAPTYKNAFLQAGYSQAQVDAKVADAFNHLFVSRNKIYTEVGTDKAYIYYDAGRDVRSEGMSYGMMIAVQMNRKDVFDRLWNWSKTYMQNSSGPYAGYFAWHCKTSGAKIDQNPASDGEIYFATALFFAAHRWGNGSSIYHYEAEANAILDTMINSEARGTALNMFDRNTKLVKLTTTTWSAGVTDPSYQLPAFFDLWASWAAQDNLFWADAATAARNFLHITVHPTTGLMPEYALMSNGAGYNTPSATGKQDFRYDAHRTIQNLSMDALWFGTDAAWQRAEAARILIFFQGQGINTYGAEWSLSGTQLSQWHDLSLVSMNATGALALDVPSNEAFSRDFVQAFWNAPLKTDRYRYYHNLLAMLAYLQLSGRYKIY
jgi:oligosaccharide reducing-end xylanase